MYSIGIDIGYSSIKVSVIDDRNSVVYNAYHRHHGSVGKSMETCVIELSKIVAIDAIKYGAVVGSGRHRFPELEGTTTVNDVAALVEGGRMMYRTSKSIIAIGGQSALYLTGFAEEQSRVKVSVNSNCSAGTGSFLEEQVSRLRLKLEDYAELAGHAESIPRIAGRCSVFAKTDIIHRQQEGVPVEDILLGLAYAVVKNYRAIVVKSKYVEMPALFAGGVAYNSTITGALRDVFSLREEDLIVPKNPANVMAAGAAVLAKKSGLLLDVEGFAARAKNARRKSAGGRELAPLTPTKQTILNNVVRKGPVIGLDRNDCYLGVDIGSTSTNLVLIGTDRRIVNSQYIRTIGDPVDAVKRGLLQLHQKIGQCVRVLGVCTTGSGRELIAEIIGADLVKDEITAQAKAAVTIDSDVDTIFEIGGQDSKYISLDNGKVIDFQMNKVCAAGTGSFIEEQATKFNIPIDSFGDIAISSLRPCKLGERCTVFIEASIAHLISEGASVSDIAAGVCYAIAKNYLAKVVSTKKIGDKIFFQGGVAHNQGVVGALYELTKKNIIVPDICDVTGAYGAAILALEEGSEGLTKFRGFVVKDSITDHVFCKAKNHISAKKRSYYNGVEKTIFGGYSGELDSSKKTVGIPRALFTFGMFPMFEAVFRALGLNVLLSNTTSEETIKLGQEHSLDEACFPVKLIIGHVAELVQKNVDYIFFPDLFSVEHPGSPSRKNYGCAYMQLASKVVRKAMGLDERNITLLSPTIAFSLGKEFMMNTFISMGRMLGKSEKEMKGALQKGMAALNDFETEVQKEARKVLGNLDLNQKTIVIISKIYGVADPVLNMGVPDKLISLGFQVLPFYYVPDIDIAEEHPNMFWPFGQHILESARLVKEHPNLFAVYLSHHGCGPDSVLSHFLKEIMGNKPYLHIEVDEHFSEVGVNTRVEAFANSLKSIKSVCAYPLESYVEQISRGRRIKPVSCSAPSKKGVLYLPNLYPYSDICKELLCAKGYNAKILPPLSPDVIDAGRKHCIVEESFSLVAFLGSALKAVESEQCPETCTFLVPQTEGAEVEGQFGRLLRTKLDEQGWCQTKVFSPFVEDAMFADTDVFEALSLCLLCGDIVLGAGCNVRDGVLETIKCLIRDDRFNYENLETIFRLTNVAGKETRSESGIRILVLGEAYVLYNDVLNDFVLQNLEKDGVRVLYGPFSEYFWLLCSDTLYNEPSRVSEEALVMLETFRSGIKKVSANSVLTGAFDNNLDALAKKADDTVGYYAGANGRYRIAKNLRSACNVDGIVTVASMYENTGITLGILQQDSKIRNSAPVLNLTFDGTRNESDRVRIDSFVYYLRENASRRAGIGLGAKDK